MCIAGIPKIHWYGREQGYNILAMDMLGPSLQDLLTYCGGRFSLKTILMIADQLVRDCFSFFSHITCT